MTVAVLPALAASIVAALLAALAWRAAVANQGEASAGTALKFGVERLQQDLDRLADSLREEQERLRQAQANEIQGLRAHLQSGTEGLQRALLTAVQDLNTGLANHYHRAEEANREVTDRLAQTQSKALQDLRTSQSNELSALRTELRQTMQESQQNLVTAVGQMRTSIDEHMHRQSEAARIATQDLATSQATALDQLTATVSQQLKEVVDRNDAARAQLADDMKTARQEQTLALQRLQQSHEQRAESLTTTLRTEHDRARQALTDGLGDLMKSNETKLEQMRATVQEKLDATLGERLDASFKQVSERLESVHKGLGEMQTLAQGVGSLQRTLTNVKTRGVWGEVQLDTLLADLLTPEQYKRQFRINPDTIDLVDFAIKLPGQGPDSPVWLALDSKFPMDIYERLLAASEDADQDAIRAWTKALTDRIKTEASSISTKYVNPPHTTDFAVMYLPAEGLFAEVLRLPGLAQELRTKYKIVVAGPTTLTAFVSSLSMGFRTLAIQKRSSEAWQVLGEVKAEFEKSGAVWEKMVRQLETASKTAHDAGVRHRAISRKLRMVESTPVDKPLTVSITSLDMAAMDEVDDSPLLLPPAEHADGNQPVEQSEEQISVFVDDAV